MAKGRSSSRSTLDSYTIKSINMTIKAGDCVLMRPVEKHKPSYVAKVDQIDSDSRESKVRVHVRWYYRPEESVGGRRLFHGSRELFLSDHYDVQSTDTIEGTCTVHSFKSYTKLSSVGSDDFFCRFEYSSASGAFNPDRVPVYCKCEMPYNPDDLMVQCEDCNDWFHPSCVDMTQEESKRVAHFYCHDCSPKDAKVLQNAQSGSKPSDAKKSRQEKAFLSYNMLNWVVTKRRRS